MRYERLFKSLSILLPESNPWQARETTLTQRVGADLYRCLTSLSVGLFLLSVDNTKGRSTKELDLLNRFLPSSEKAMLYLNNSRGFSLQPPKRICRSKMADSNRDPQLQFYQSFARGCHVRLKQSMHSL